jgi:hypothetical protein
VSLDEPAREIAERHAVSVASTGGRRVCLLQCVMDAHENPL